MKEEITYEDIHQSEDNLWNFLFFTGYLKKISLRIEEIERYITLAIPNDELLYVFTNTIESWFLEEVKVQNLNSLYRALLKGNYTPKRNYRKK